jgi:poly(3-hydroxybutyrate) depolymerase
MKRIMNYFFVFIVTLFSPLTADCASEKIVKESILSNGQERSYYLCVPKAVSTVAPAPLLVTLHGSGRDGVSLVEKWKPIAAKEGIILVGPNSQSSKGWATPADGPRFLYELIEGLRQRYPIRARQVYLFGHSGGAVFALLMSLMESEYFAAAAVHAGSLRQAEGHSVIRNAKRKIPLAIFIGTEDEYFPVAEVRATRDQLNANGFTVELREIAGHNHGYYGLAAKINCDAWEFLKNKELATDPRYEQYPFGK